MVSHSTKADERQRHVQLGSHSEYRIVQNFSSPEIPLPWYKSIPETQLLLVKLGSSGNSDMRKTICETAYMGRMIISTKGEDLLDRKAGNNTQSGVQIYVLGRFCLVRTNSVCRGEAAPGDLSSPYLRFSKTLFQKPSTAPLPTLTALPEGALYIPISTVAPPPTLPFSA